MKKKDFIAKVSRKTGFSQRDIDDALHGIFDTIADVIGQGDTINIPNFGRFSGVWMDDKTYINPMTGEEGFSPGHYKPKFKAAQRLRNGMKEV